MKDYEFQAETRDGLTLFGRGRGPAKVKGVICLVHGMGEHCGRYGHFFRFFDAKGFACLSLDLRGHGKSEGKRGHTPSYSRLLDDVDLLLARAADRYPSAPRFLYGHSMGGNLVVNHGLRRHSEAQGIVASSPWLELAFQPPWIKVALGRLMNRIYPGMGMSAGLETEALCRDPAVVKAYVDDPLVHGKITPRLFLGMYESGRWALDHASELGVPILLMHGTGDRLTSAEASKDFCNKAGGECRIKLWPGLYHELHNEPEKKEVMEFADRWLDQRLGGA